MAKASQFHGLVERSLDRRKVSGAGGAFIDLMLPFLLQLLQGCLTPKPTPTPQPATSVASAEAWKTADETQAFAISKIKEGSPDAENVTYRRTASNAAVRGLRAKNRKNGTPMSKAEAVEYVFAHLDAARLGTLEDNALAIDQAS